MIKCEYRQHSSSKKRKRERDTFMVYVIKITIDGKIKYIYTAAAAVDVMESAHRFNSRSYAKRYILNHRLKNAEVIRIDKR